MKALKIDAASLKYVPIKSFLLALASALILAGCNTTEGIKEDAEEAGEVIEEAVEDVADEAEDVID